MFIPSSWSGRGPGLYGLPGRIPITRLAQMPRPVSGMHRPGLGHV